MSTYIDEFLRLSCAPRFLASRTLPSSAPAKEITEIMGAWHAIKDQLGPECLGRRDVLLLDVGCGRAPRAATLLAMMSRWTCLGIDPRVRRWGGTRRVSTTRSRAEIAAGEIARGRDPLPRPGLVVCLNIHGHAPLAGPDGYVPVLASPASVVAEVEALIVAIPCCVPLELPAPPVADYEDPEINSPANRVVVWRGRMCDLVRQS